MAKTKERIIFTSLALFNEQGEANITSVDIANELDISPGNLYYHFKGKEEIILALFELYRERLNQVIFSPATRQVAVQDLLHLLYVVLDISFTFRFLYRNPSDLSNKYPELGKKFYRVLLDKEKGLTQILQGLLERQLLTIEQKKLALLVNNVSLIMTQYINYQLLKKEDINEAQSLQQGMSALFFALTPYLALTTDELNAIAAATFQY